MTSGRPRRSNSMVVAVDSYAAEQTAHKEAVGGEAPLQRPAKPLWQKA